MTRLTRRRFLSISAAACASACAWPHASARAGAAPLTQWRGIALGAQATITLRHPDAAALIERARREIARLEAIFSLHRAESSLSRLNANGRIDNPPFEMLELLSLCAAANAVTRGLFDPTVQPLWACYAEAYAAGHAPDPAAVRAALGLVGWRDVRVAPDAVAYARAGMAMTLNGIAQGYIADRVAALLEREGLTDVLVDTGEMKAPGGHPDGGPWRVALDLPQDHPATSVELRAMALASSSPLGTVLDAAGKVGHILNPRTGVPAEARWNLVSVTSPSAAVADALSTAFCLMTRHEIDEALAAEGRARLVYAA